MKRLYKCSVLVIFTAVIFLLTGCSAHSPISADAFKSAAEKSGFTVTANNENSNFDSYLIAKNSKTDSNIEFVAVKSENDAQNLYNTLKDSIVAGNNKAKTVDTSAYCRYAVANGEIYHVLVRLDKTVVYGKTTTSNSNAMDQFFSSIKY